MGPLTSKQVGKIKYSKLPNTTDMQAKTRSHMSKRNSEDIKESLVKKFFVEEKPQDMIKAPKTKLVTTVQPKVEEVSKPIEPKKQWKPPQPILPVPEKPK